MVAILGPTASGKSALAEHLARAFAGELINSDASAFYRELSVGVTKPSPETRREFRYHLLDLTTLEQGYDLMDYLEVAEKAIEKVHRGGALPIVVGGSGLYARALLDGYRPHSIEVTDEIRQHVRSLDLPLAQQELLALDPKAYDRIDLKNPRRVTRALELAMANGGPVEPSKKIPRTDLRIQRFYLQPAKPLLDARIKKRTEEMWEPWVEEVVQLEKKGLIRWLEVRRPIGYSSVLAFNRGEMSRDQAIETVVRQTVKLAKKQKTWLKKETEHEFCHHFLIDRQEQWERVPETASALLAEFLS